MDAHQGDGKGPQNNAATDVACNPRAGEAKDGKNDREYKCTGKRRPEEDDGDLLEPWVEWIRRITHNVENNLKRLNIKTWMEQARKRKWRFAAELYSGRGEQKWTHLARQWNPQLHHDGTRPTAHRNPTRPNLRWTDELHNFVRDNVHPERTWSEVCSNPEFWTTHESIFFINRESELT